MSTTYNGQCNCGAITVSVAKLCWDDNSHIYTCYCPNCRAAGGAPYCVISHIPVGDFKITSGSPKTYLDLNTGSGRGLNRQFCSNCGSPIYSAQVGDTTHVLVKAGLFPPGITQAPSSELFRETAESWTAPIVGAAQHSRMDPTFE